MEAVKHIPPRDYFPTLTREIEQAQESIVAYLYQFTINAENSNSLPLKIAEALIQAKKRGVHVEVILDQKYAREKVDFVYDKLKLKNPDNPKRSAGYFINTVKSL